MPKVQKGYELKKIFPIEKLFDSTGVNCMFELHHNGKKVEYEKHPFKIKEVFVVDKKGQFVGEHEFNPRYNQSQFHLWVGMFEDVDVNFNLIMNLEIKGKEHTFSFPFKKRKKVIEKMNTGNRKRDHILPKMEG